MSVDGKVVEVGSRAFSLLLALARKPGQLVTKEQLFDAAWPNTVVHENNLPAQILVLRKLLGADVILTVPGRGYRLAAALSVPHGTSKTSDDAVELALPFASSPALPLPGMGPGGISPVSALTELQGRETDLASLDSFIAGHRLVSLIGPGGVGKSLLAKHLLNQRRGHHPHGICWVELAALNDESTVCEAIAAALGLHATPGPALERLVRALAPLQLLLALDNAEHQQSAVSSIAQALYAGAPGVHLLVTSQVPLHLAEEQVFRLAPLAVPDKSMTAEQALSFGAVALFERRARAADRSFRLTDELASTCIALCRALDGLPLAIELAAARCALLGLPGLTASLRDRLNLLTTSANQFAPERQQTLRATLDWSHALLDPRECLVFRRLGVVAGTASLELVQALAAEPDRGLDQWRVLDALQSLVERSLVAVTHHAQSTQPPRYRLLESPHLYALERLEDAGEAETVQRRQALAMAELAVRADRELWDGSIGLDAWQERLEPDLDNARVAFEWARSHGEPAAAVAIAVALLHALPKSQQTAGVSMALACESLLGPAIASELLTQAWLSISWFWVNAQLLRSEHAAQQALELARACCGSAPDAGFQLYAALSQWAIVQARLERLDIADAALLEMRSHEVPTWPPQRLCIGAGAQTVLAIAHNQPDRALSCARAHLALRQAAGSNGHVAISNLMDAQIAAGEAADAVRTGDLLLARLEGSRDAFMVCSVRLNLTAALLSVGELARARQLAAQGWEPAMHFGLTRFWADYLVLLAASEGRTRSAALIAGYSAGVDARTSPKRSGNEAHAYAQGCALARLHLGEEPFQRLFDEGRVLPSQSVLPLALGLEDGYGA